MLFTFLTLKNSVSCAYFTTPNVCNFESGLSTMMFETEKRLNQY